MVLASCLVCGEDFEKNRPWQVYCDRRCKDKARDVRRSETDSRAREMYLSRQRMR